MGLKGDYSTKNTEIERLKNCMKHAKVSAVPKLMPEAISGGQV